MTTTDKDVRRVTQALLTLQEQGRRQREEGDVDDAEETDRGYAELCQEAGEKARRTEKYAMAVLASAKFYQALSAQDGK